MIEQGDMFGWSCDQDAQCPLYYDRWLPGANTLGDLTSVAPDIGAVKFFGLQFDEVWSIGVQVERTYP